MTLSEYNNISRYRLKSLENYELIEKVLFNKEENDYIGQLLKRISRDYLWDEIYNNKEVITLFLVGCAKYYYNNGDGGFWHSIDRLTNCQPSFKKDVIDVFHITIRLYKLANLESERVGAFTQMGSILAHAGLAENLEMSLVFAVSPIFGKDIPFENLGEIILSQNFKMTESIKSYLNILNKLGTLNDFIFDVLKLFNNADLGVDESLMIPISLQEKIISFQQNKSINTQRIIKPELVYSYEDCQFYIEFPEEKVLDTDKIVWKVYNDEEILMKNIVAEHIKDGFFFRSTVLKINPGKNIYVKLYNDENVELQTYTIKEEGKAICFNHKGVASNGYILTSNGGYVLIDCEYLSNNDIDIVENYCNTTLYYVSITSSNIVFTDHLGNTIIIIIKKPIEIVCDNKLFSNSCKFSGIDGYYSLPEISIPVVGEWHLQIKNENEKFNYDISVSDETTIIKLEDYLPENFYGEISVRLISRKLGIKTFKFIYLPYVKVIWDNYQAGTQGYKKSYIKFLNSQDSIILSEEGDYLQKYEITEDQAVFKGVYKYKEHSYKFQFNVRAYSWVIENNNEVLGIPNVFTQLSIKDISSNGNCLLELKNNTNESIYLIMENGNEDRIPYEIKPYSQKTIDFKEYVEYFTSNTNMAIVYIEQNFKKICNICSIRKNLAIKNLQMINFYNLQMISWEEDGVKSNREINCRYINAPYDFFTIPIPDGETSVNIDNEDERFYSGLIMEIVAKKEYSIFDIEEEEQDLLDSTNSIIYNPNETFYPRFSFNVGNFQDLKNAVYTYLTYRFNKKLFSDEETYKKCIGKLLTYIYESRIIFGDEVLIDIVLKYKLTQKQYIMIRKDFGFLHPILKKENDISTQSYLKIEQYDKLLYVIYVFFKHNEEHLYRVSAYNFTYLDRFKDKKDLELKWASVSQLFPQISENIQIEKMKKLALHFNRDYRDSEAYLDALVDSCCNAFNRNSKEEIKEYKQLAKYVENVATQYPKTLITTMFKQLSKRRM